MEYPYDEKLSPALWGTYEVDGKVYKTGMQLLYERCEEFTLEKAAEICWLDADRIKAAIEMYLENAPSGICLVWQRTRHRTLYRLPWLRIRLISDG